MAYYRFSVSLLKKSSNRFFLKKFRPSWLSAESRSRKLKRYHDQAPTHSTTQTKKVAVSRDWGSLAHASGIGSAQVVTKGLHCFYC